MNFKSLTPVHLAILAVILAVSPAHSSSPFGPLAVRNHHPLYVGLLYPSPESATIAGKTTWVAAINHSNIFMRSGKRVWVTSIDKELTELDITARVPTMNDRLELSFDVPLYYSSAGFLDSFVRWYHNAIGAPSFKGQEQTDDFQFDDRIFHNRKLVMKGEMGVVGLGDISFGLKYRLYAGEKWDLALQALGQAPTGDADKDRGSGGWEAGARLLATHNSDWIYWSLGAGYLFPGQIKRNWDTVSYDPMFAGFVSAEYVYSQRLRLIVQSMFNNSPLGAADNKQMRRQWLEVTFGFKYQLPNGLILAAGLSENIVETQPDFTLHFSLQK